MHALDRTITEDPRQVLPHRLGQKRDEGGDQLAGAQQALVERPVGVHLVFSLLVTAPKPIAAAADVPVAQRVDEGSELRAGGEVVVGVHPLDDRSRWSDAIR